ncbi:MAG: TolC family protein [Culturomica sp.]|jgi:outer membrane protein|nr:TolC family protein [Culturomica sp.]
MKFTFITILILFAELAKGQSVMQVQKFTLQECMEYAVEHSLKIAKQDAQNEINTQNYREAIAMLLPSVSGNVGTSFNFGRGLDGETNTYVDVNSFNNNYSISSEWLLFGGFSGINRMRIQNVNRLAGNQQLQEVVDMTAYETMEAFYNVVYCKEMVKLSEEQLKNSRESLQQVERMEELGVKSFPDVAEMRAKEAADNFNLTKHSNLMKIGIIQLKEKMNFPLETELDVVIEKDEAEVSKSAETAMGIFNQAKDFLPKVLSAESKLKSQKLNRSLSKGALLPSIYASAGVSTNFFRYMDGAPYQSFKDQFRDKRGSYIGLSLSIPIFNNLNRSSTMRRSRYQVEIATAERDETLRQVYGEVEQAVADMNGQADEYAQAVKQREAIAIAHKVNVKKYAEGLISPLELHTSADRLYNSQIEELNSLLRYRLKQRLVRYYKGEPFVKSKN